MVVRIKRVPLTDLAWAFVGFGVMIFLCGSGWSIAQARDYNMRLAEFQLEVGAALHKVKKVSHTLEETAKTSTIAPKDKQKILEATDKSDRFLDAVEADIEEEASKLINLEMED